jgi:hypothetical protein
MTKKKCKHDLLVSHNGEFGYLNTMEDYIRAKYCPECGEKLTNEDK